SGTRLDFSTPPDTRGPPQPEQRFAPIPDASTFGSCVAPLVSCHTAKLPKHPPHLFHKTVGFLISLAQHMVFDNVPGSKGISIFLTFGWIARKGRTIFS